MQNTDGYLNTLDGRRKLAQDEAERQARLEKEYEFTKLKLDNQNMALEISQLKIENDRLRLQKAALMSQVTGLGHVPVAF